MKFNLEHYNKSPLQRILLEVIRMARKKGNQEKYSCEHEPLLKIELDHVVLDELHFLLRIMHALINNLVKETVNGTKKKIHQRKGEQRNNHLKNLWSTIRSCGISFDIWEKTNADGKGSGLYDFTSLLGGDKKKLVSQLPSKRSSVFTLKTAKQHKNMEQLTWPSSNHYKQEPLIPSIHHLFQWNESMGWFVYIPARQNTWLQKGGCDPIHACTCVSRSTYKKKYKSVKSFTGEGMEKILTWREMFFTSPASKILLLMYYDWNFNKWQFSAWAGMLKKDIQQGKFFLLGDRNQRKKGEKKMIK